MKEKIMEATYHLVAKHGYDKTSLSQVAQAVSIQKSSLYHHFPSKEAIFLAVIDRYYTQSFQVHGLEFKNLSTPQEFHFYLQNIGKNLLADFQNNPELRLFCEEINLQERRNPTVAQHLSQWDLRSRESLFALLQRGEELSALVPHLDLKLQVDTIVLLLIGMSESQLCQMDLNCMAVWQDYVQRICPSPHWVPGETRPNILPKEPTITASNSAK